MRCLTSHQLRCHLTLLLLLVITLPILFKISVLYTCYKKSPESVSNIQRICFKTKRLHVHINIFLNKSLCVLFTSIVHYLHFRQNKIQVEMTLKQHLIPLSVLLIPSWHVLFTVASLIALLPPPPLSCQFFTLLKNNKLILSFH